MTKYRKYRQYSHGFSELALHIHTFLQTRLSYATQGWNWQKNQTKAKQHPEAELRYFKIIHLLYSRYHTKVIGDILKNVEKTSTSV